MGQMMPTNPASSSAMMRPGSFQRVRASFGAPLAPIAWSMASAVW